MPKGIYPHKRIPPEIRFWKFVKKTKGCWLWTGTKRKFGYGDFERMTASRFSYIMHKEKVPLGLCVCHSCDNPPCVNPKHLWLGTRKDNFYDMMSKKRDIHVVGESNGKSKLSAKQVVKIRSLYKTGKYSQRKLGYLFSVSHRCIGELINKKTWREAV